jgi:AraC-like DNA-binding protein/quercetin dioxygenase-like cupin family protein
MLAAPLLRPLPSRAVLRQWTFERRYAGTSSAHATVEIAWCTSGTADYVIGNKTVTLHPGEAIVIPANVEHRTTVAQGGTFARALHVPADTVASAAEAVGVRLVGASFVPGSVERPSPLTTLGALLAREADEDRRGKALAVEALTDAVIVEALRGADGPAPPAAPDSRLRRAIDVIHDRYADPLTIDELSRAAGMSRYHFSRLFRAQTGKSPYRYLLDVRMTRAAHLLRAKRCPVTEAAFSVGCTDLGRFGRMFRAVHGVRPSEYLHQASLS